MNNSNNNSNNNNNNNNNSNSNSNSNNNNNNNNNTAAQVLSAVEGALWLICALPSDFNTPGYESEILARVLKHA